MFGSRFTFMKVAGIPLRVDFSWFIIFFVVVWSLAVGVFPGSLPGAAPGLYWIMGIGGALGLFVSIVLHEFGHAAAARRCGIEMDGITLFIFGGVAEMRDDPPNAMSEFTVAIAGPLVTMVIALTLLLVAQILPDGPTAVVFAYLALINAVVLVFNLIPAFPLDGGRVLRAGLWAWRRDLRWATGISASTGVIFAFVLFGLAVVALFGGNFIGAMWWFLLGLFLQNAARASYQQVLWKQVLTPVPVRSVMRREPHTVAPDLRLDAFIEQYVYRYHHKMFPVVAGEDLIGCIDVETVRDVSRDDWTERRVADVLTPCDDANTISEDESALTALRRMTQNSSSRLMAVDNGRLTGIVALRDLMGFVSRRLEFEDHLATRP